MPLRAAFVLVLGAIGLRPRAYALRAAFAARPLACAGADRARRDGAGASCSSSANQLGAAAALPGISPRPDGAHGDDRRRSWAEARGSSKAIRARRAATRRLRGARGHGVLVRCGRWRRPPARRCRSPTTCGSSFSSARRSWVSAWSVAARLAPPPPLDVAAPRRRSAPRAAGSTSIGAVATSLLISVDALRADHVGAYGYARPTTPNIDAPGARGALFLRAYCPTPHTSYSVTSMMTGKNLRPLLAQGLGRGLRHVRGRLLRTYGYRTAAFYPPAVFFIDEQLLRDLRDRQLDFEYAQGGVRRSPRASAPAVERTSKRPRRTSRSFCGCTSSSRTSPTSRTPSTRSASRDVDRYDSEIAAADAAIGEIVERRRAAPARRGGHGHRRSRRGVRRARRPLPRHDGVRGAGAGAARRGDAGARPASRRDPGADDRCSRRPCSLRSTSRGPRGFAGHNLGATPVAESRPPAAAERKWRSPRPTIRRLLADAEWRLVCARRAGACALYNLDLDPGEARDVSTREPRALRRHERPRCGGSRPRRDGTSEGEEARERSPREAGRGPSPFAAVSRVTAKRRARLPRCSTTAMSCFGARRPRCCSISKRKEGASELRLALSRDEDDAVRRWCALALTRLGEGAPRTIELLEDPDPTWRRLAALALAENGDARGGRCWSRGGRAKPPPYPRAREVLAALAQIRAKEATPVLIRSLDDVRLRPYVAETLGGHRSDVGARASRRAMGDRAIPKLARGHRRSAREARRQVRAGRAAGALSGDAGSAAQRARISRGARAFCSTWEVCPTTNSCICDPTRHAVFWSRSSSPPGGNGSGRRVLVRARTNDGRRGQVRIGSRLEGLAPARHNVQSEADKHEIPLVELDPRGAVTLEFLGGTPTEASATLPPESRGGYRGSVRGSFVPQRGFGGSGGGSAGRRAGPPGPRALGTSIDAAPQATKVARPWPKIATRPSRSSSSRNARRPRARRSRSPLARWSTTRSRAVWRVPVAG